MAKKLFSYNDLSDRVCVKCNCNRLKKNLVTRQPNAHICYKCWCREKGKSVR